MFIIVDALDVVKMFFSFIYVSETFCPCIRIFHHTKEWKVFLSSLFTGSVLTKDSFWTLLISLSWYIGFVLTKDSISVPQIIKLATEAIGMEWEILAYVLEFTRPEIDRFHLDYPKKVIMNWHDMTWRGLLWHDLLWHDLLWHGLLWPDLLWHVERIGAGYSAYMLDFTRLEIDPFHLDYPKKGITHQGPNLGL